MPGLKRSKPNLRMLRLLVLVVLLVVIVLGIRQIACAGDPADSRDPDGRTVDTVGAGSEVTVSVGDAISAEGLTLVVTSLAPMRVPTGPRYPMEDTAARSLGDGETYYQAFARAENKGDGVARFDPEDFSLDAKGVLIGPEPSLTGPGARSLLHGATLDIMLTFIGPEGLDPRLVYRPKTGGIVIIEGEVTPDIFDGVSTTSLDRIPADGSPTPGGQALS